MQRSLTAAFLFTSNFLLLTVTASPWRAQSATATESSGSLTETALLYTRLRGFLITFFAIFFPRNFACERISQTKRQALRYKGISG